MEKKVHNRIIVQFNQDSYFVLYSNVYIIEIY